MSPLPRRMLGRAASWENPQVHPYPLPEGLTYVAVAVAIRPFVGSPHQILNSPYQPPLLVTALFDAANVVGLHDIHQLLQFRLDGIACLIGQTTEILGLLHVA